ncbi:MAG: hypothetical protein F6K16_33740 [Symploca sp. SIO2B6]|nr:hypothetical protein [Symploca sp. SIO2B6]
MVMDLMVEDYLNVDFSLQGEAIAIKTLMTRYQSVPMSLADACLVRMAERYNVRTTPRLRLDLRFVGLDAMGMLLH